MNFDALHIGVYLCILVQLVPLTFVNALQKNAQNRILAIICMLFMVSILKIAFWTPLQKTWLFWIIGGPHVLLFPSILFLYVNNIAHRYSKRVWLHWFVPLVLYILIHPVKLAIYGWPEDPFGESLPNLIIFLPFFIFYYVKSTRLIREETSENLNLKFYLRFKLFYYSVNIYLLTNVIFLLPLSINIHLEDPVLREFNFQYTFPVYVILFRYLFAIPCIALIFYALTEISRLKRHIVNAVGNKKSQVNKSDLDEIKQLIARSNFFLDPKANIHSFLEKNDISRPSLKSFLEQNGYTNFNEMVNALRVNEFKRRIDLKESHKYDLVSLAKESGFNSKASFYRVFKQLEGMTPNQYLKDPSRVL